jgi:hypothetical protein
MASKAIQKPLKKLKNFFEKNRVEVIFIPPHSSDQVQPLDLLGFNLLKLSKNKSYINFQKDTSDQTR